MSTEDNTKVDDVKAEDVLFKDEKTTEVKTPEAKAETEGTGQEEKVDEKSPEVVEDDFKLEVTAESGLKAEDAESVKKFAKENNLTKDAAQKILNDKAQAIVDFKKSQQDDFNKKKVEWLEHAKADKEIGGEQLNQSVTMANRFLDEYAPKELRQVLDDTGLGNHPLLIKTFARAQKKMSNDSLVQAPKSQAAKTVADWDLFYPDDKK